MQTTPILPPFYVISYTQTVISTVEGCSVKQAARGHELVNISVGNSY
jgi:hypothetical protein